MQVELKTLLKEAIRTCLPILGPLSEQHTRLSGVWKRTSQGQWSGKLEPRPDLAATLVAAGEQLAAASEPLAEAFFRHYPQYEGLVGLSGLGRINLSHQRAFLFHSLLAQLWRTHETFEIGEREIDSLIDEFEEFVDNPTVRLVFRSELLNFRATSDKIELPEQLQIRRMTQEEVSDRYGDQILAPNMIATQGYRGVQEFCIEGEIEEIKVFGDTLDDATSVLERVKTSLDKAILSTSPHLQ